MNSGLKSNNPNKIKFLKVMKNALRPNLVVKVKLLPFRGKGPKNLSYKAHYNQRNIP